MAKKISIKKYAVALYEATVALPPSALPAAINNFLVILERHHLLLKLPRLIEEFKTYAQKQEGEIPVQISTAKPLSDETLNLVASELKQSLNQNVVVKNISDLSLIGGAAVRIADTIVDGTLKNQLENLRLELSKSY